MSDREKWNQRYSDSLAARLGTEPSEWLASHRSLLVDQPKGRALDVAGGAGRNAFYLAELGFDVDVWDISDVAVEAVAGEAARRGLGIRARQCDLTETEIPVEAFQVVVNLNFLERSLFHPLSDALVPGGLLFFQAFVEEDASVARRPMNPRFVLESRELLEGFPCLEALDYREEVEAETPRGSRSVARLLARRHFACPKNRTGERLMG